MARILKYVLIFVLIIFLVPAKGNAEPNYVVQPVSATSSAEQSIMVNKQTTEPQNVSLTIPQIVSFEQCTKKYMIPVDKLYFLSLASVNANKFTINEIQSKTGYILFTVANRQFLASVNRVDDKSSILKIVPADNNYYFPLGILTNFFKYIDLNLTAQIEELG